MLQAWTRRVNGQIASRSQAVRNRSRALLSLSRSIRRALHCDRSVTHREASTTSGPYHGKCHSADPGSLLYLPEQATAADVQWVVEAYSLFLAALILVEGSLVNSGFYKQQIQSQYV